MCRWKRGKSVLFIPMTQLMIFGKMPPRKRREEILKYLAERSWTGKDAEEAAEDIMRDIRRHGLHRGE